MYVYSYKGTVGGLQQDITNLISHMPQVYLNDLDSYLVDSKGYTEEEVKEMSEDQKTDLIEDEDEYKRWEE